MRELTQMLCWQMKQGDRETLEEAVLCQQEAVKSPCVVLAALNEDLGDPDLNLNPVGGRSLV